MEGCRVESDAVPKVGDYLELSLRFPEPEPPLRIDSAVVRWVRGRLFGVEFLYMPTESLKRLPRLIEGLRKQPPADAPTEPDKRGDG